MKSIKYVVKYPDKDKPTQRWCFVRMKPPPRVPQDIEGEGKYLMWDGYNHWSGTGEDLWVNYSMDEVAYWLEKVKPNELNKF